MGCKSNVEKVLSEVEEITDVDVNLEKGEATITMTSHLSVEDLQRIMNEGGLHYTIGRPGENNDHEDHSEANKSKSSTGTGVFYCPMHCEGEKTYDEPGNCPVCGMDLVELDERMFDLRHVKNLQNLLKRSVIRSCRRKCGLVLHSLFLYS